MADGNLGVIYYEVEAKTDALIKAERAADKSITKVSAKLKESGEAARHGSFRMKEYSRSIQNMGRSAADALPSMNALYKIFAAVALVKTAKEVIRLADAWQSLENRLRLVTSSNKELDQSLDDVFRIAQGTSQEIDTIAQVYQRFAQNADDLGLSLTDVAEVTDVVAKAVAVSGASAAAAEAALVQFGQALASGVLRGEELNSVMEQTPALAQAIARGMGIAVGDLRKVAAEGKITADVLIDALKRAGDSVDEQFGTRIKTAGQAWVEMQNSITRFVGKLSSGTTMTSQLADAISAVSAAIDNVDLDRMSQELEGIKAIIALVIDGAKEIYGVFKEYFPKAADVVGMSMTDLALGVARTVDGVTEVFTGAVGAIQELWRGLAYNIPAFFDNAWITVKSGAAQLVNFLADILNKPLEALGVATFDKVTFGSEKTREIRSLSDAFSEGWKEAERNANAFNRTLNRVTDRAIQASIAEWQDEYSESSDRAAASTEKLEEVTKSNSKANNDAAKAAEQNKMAIEALERAIHFATLSGVELAKAKAASSLNEFATSAEIDRIKGLAAALYELELAEQNRQLLAEMDPVEAERQRFEEQLGNLQRLNEARLLEDQRYYELKEGLEREHIERMRLAEEERFAAQNWQNEMIIKGLNSLEQASASALTGLISGANNSTQAIQQLAAGISQELIGSLVKMGMEQVKAWAMGKVAQSAAAAGYATSVQGQVAANTALAAQAAFASTAAIPITGPAMAPAAAAAAASAAGALGAPAIAASALTMAGARFYGGPVEGGGKMYRINEGGAPEILNSADGKQYLLPNSRGQVVSNKDAAGGTQVNVSVVINSDGSISAGSDSASWAEKGREMGESIRSIVKDELYRANSAGGMIRANHYG